MDGALGLACQALLGMATFLLLALVCSEAPRRVRPLQVVGALLAQVALAFATLHVGPVRAGLLWISRGIGSIKDATLAGTAFVFGYAGGAPVPFAVLPGRDTFIFGFQALPMVMVVSALAMLLFHWRILPWVVRACAGVLRRTLGIGGALGVCAAAKVFLGQTEAPLLIRPYLGKLSRSELFTVMTLGMATTSASVMVLYASILEHTVPDALGHILTASVISVPGAVALSRLFIPHTDADTDGDALQPYAFGGAMEAIAFGASEGLKLFLNIIAMLIVMLALVTLGNTMLGNITLPSGEPLSLQLLLGWVLAPVAWLMGIPWHEAQSAGQLIGIKLVLNEVMAFLGMVQLKEGAVGAHTHLIMTYALCGFANLSSIGIQIAGLGTLIPERREEIIGLAFKSLLAGTMASCLSGTVVGLLHALSL